jgi:hypothetical protein
LSEERPGLKTRSARPRLGLIIFFFVASIVLGFVFTYKGVATWDSLPHLDRSRWLIHKYGLPISRPVGDLTDHLKWYGPLWALILGVLAEVIFGFLHDPMWVQHAFNFALLPIGLFGIYRLLARAGVGRPTVVLAIALLFGMIRLAGHALVNVNDFPFAMAYLLVTLYLWNKLRELHPTALALTLTHDAAQGNPGVPLRKRTLVLLGIVSTIPYLVRPPVFVHTLALVGFLYFYSRWVLKTPRRRDRLLVTSLPLISGLAFMWAVWPSMWEKGWRGWLAWLGSFATFTHFTWIGPVRFFGHTAMSNHLPWWYPLVWLPVILNPLAFVAFLAGLVSYLRQRGLQPQSFVLDTAFGRIDLSLRRWLMAFAALSWAGVLLVHPVVYDEERHLLFLYPPLVILAAMGLDRLSPRLRYGISALVIAASLSSYFHWGRYSYVYKSSLVGNRSSAQFTGDYWGVCVPLAVAALKDLVPVGSEILVREPFDAASIQYTRLREARFSGLPDFGPYRLVPRTKSVHYYEILYNRFGFSDRALEAARTGRAKILWRTTMPPGDLACVIAEYPG